MDHVSREIVLASHLKPLDKEDKMPTTGFRQPWNTMADGSAAGPSRQSQDISLVGLNFMCAMLNVGCYQYSIT